MRRMVVGLLAVALAAGSAILGLGCGDGQGARGASSSAVVSAVRHPASLAVPKPIPGGDFIPDLPHHKAGIIHQFFPIDVSLGGDGPLAEPNEITDFDGLVAQVFQSGTAVDNAGTAYFVDVDTRVYVGEYVGTNGERAFGAFCTI